jgi:hypothetical protein
LRRSIATFLMLLALAACDGGGGGRELATYYDPEGHFTARLPAANALTVTPPQPAGQGPGLLTGVIASPPAPSPSPQAGIGGGAGIAAQQSAGDQTMYQAYAYTTDTFADLDEMTAFFLTADPAIDVEEDDPIAVAGSPGRLIVASATQDGAVTASVAAAMTLGRGGTGFIVAAVFPPGEWDAERGDFLEIVESFEAGVPPGATTFDLAPATT